MFQLNKKTLTYLAIIGGIISINIIILALFITYSFKKTSLNMSNDSDHQHHHDDKYQNHAQQKESNSMDDNLKIAKDADLIYLNLDEAKTKELNLKSLKAKLIWIHIWTTWCPVCKKETSLFMELQKKLSELYTQDQVQILYLNIDQKKENLIDYMKIKKDMNLPIYIAKDLAKFSVDYGISGIPHNILIKDRESIIFEHSGTLNYKKEEFLNLFKKELSK